MTNFHRRIAVVISTIAIVAVAWILVLGFLITPYDLRILREEIPCVGLVRGPVRVMLLSDVDFPRYRSNLDRVSEAARQFDPDLVLVAGDFLDRRSMVVNPAIRSEAQKWFSQLPAKGRRFLAPGEAESPAVGLLRLSWSPEEIEPIANESRQLEIRGERLDMFVADRRTDPAPWRATRNGTRPTARVDCRGSDTYIQYGRPEAASWRNVDLSFAVRLGPADGRFLVRLVADPATDPRAGAALIVSRDEDHPAFRFHARGQGEMEIRGRRQSAFVPATGMWNRCRFRLTDREDATRVQARFWVEGTDEPAVWMIDVTVSASQRSRQGTIAIGGERGSIEIADLIVADDAGEVLLHEDFDDATRFRADWRQWSRFAVWLESPTDQSARLVLAHSPDVVQDVAGSRGGPVSLVLAGHTHGGQVALPWFGPMWIDSRLGRRYDRGLFQVAGTPLFITAGVGTSVVPIRLGVAPDVALLTLVPVRARLSR